MPSRFFSGGVNFLSYRSFTMKRSRMDPISDIAAFCRRHVTEEKIIVAPTHAVGRQIRQRLAREGAAWMNLRVRTLQDFAAGLVSDGTAPAPDVMTSVRAECLLEYVSRDEHGRQDDAAAWHAPLRGSRGFYRALLQSLEDCTLADIDAASIPDDIFAHAEKAGTFRSLAARFSDACARQSVLTGAMLMLQASRAAAHAHGPPWLLIDDAFLASLRHAERGVLAASGTVIPFRRDHSDSQTVHFRTAENEDSELRAVFREVLRSGGRWDEVEIVLARENLIPLAFELTRLFDIPATFDPGVPLHYSKAARTVTAWLNWIASGYDATHLIRMMYDGVPAPYESVVDGVKGGRLQMAHLLRAAAIGWGRDRILPQLERAIARLSAAAGSDTAKDVLQARANTAWIRQLLEITPREHDGRLSLRETAAGARALITGMCRDKYPGEKEAMHRLADLLAEYAAIPDLRHPPSAIAQRLLEDIRGAFFPMVLQEPGTPPVPTTRPLPGHLHISTLERGGWCGRTATFLLGADARTLPGTARQNPILLDSERERISVHIGVTLPRSTEYPVRRSTAFDALRRRCAGTLTISWPAEHLADGSPRFPSRLLLDTLRSRNENESLTYGDLYAAAGAPSGTLPGGQPLSLSEYVLGLRDGGNGGAVTRLLHETWPLLREGARAERARRSETFTAWDGFVGDAVPSAEPRYSASSLQKLAKCPYAWFLEHRLGLREPEPWLRDNRRWLDAAQYGLLLHCVLFRFMRALMRETAQPDPALHGTLIADIAEEAMRETERDIPVPSAAARLAVERRLHADCAIFLRTEAAEGGRPLLLEIPFGRGEEEHAVPLDTGTRTVALSGRIDRIDDCGDGCAAVWDYKSGAVTSNPKKPLDRGRDIQHALYAHAAREILLRRGMPVRRVTAGYYALSERGQGRRVQMPDCSDEFPQVVALLDELRATQVFPHSSDMRSCDACRFQPVCGAAADITRESNRKLENEENNPMLKPYRRLQHVR